MTMQQTGGRYEHLTLILGVVMVLQCRMFHQRSSLLQVADLERGFACVPPIMLRWLLWQAGLTSWTWLTGAEARLFPVLFPLPDVRR